MKRILVFLFILCLITLQIIACRHTGPLPQPLPKDDPVTEQQPSDPDPLVEPSPEPVTLVVWESRNGPDEFIRQAGAAFTALYPHVTIEYVHVELGDTVNTMMTYGPDGVGADIFAAPHDRLPDLVSAGIISPVINADDVKNNVFNSSFLAASYNGVLYGYPVSSQTYALFYNRDLISNPPTTFSEIIRFAEDFNNPGLGKFGFYMEFNSPYYAIIFTTKGGNLLFGPDGTDTANTFLNSPSAIEGVEFKQSLREILPISASDINAERGNAGFIAGDIAMLVTGAWMIPDFIEAGLDFGIAPLPVLPGDNTPAKSFSETRLMFVSNFTHHSDTAHAFAEFLTSPEMQRLRFDMTGAMPAANIPIGDQHLEGLMQQLEFAFPIPSIPQIGDFWSFAGITFSGIWDGEDVRTELDALNAAIIG